MTLAITHHCLIAIIGLSFGSFFTVIIYRIPQVTRGDISLSNALFQSSHCTACNHRLRARHLIPIISFIAQKGRCVFCKKSIHCEYALIELATAFLFSFIINHLGLSFFSLMQCIFQSGLMILCVIDYKHYLLPNLITMPLMACGLFQTSVLEPEKFTASILGCLIGYSMCWIIRHSYFWIKRKHGLGMGDAKLCAMIGAWLGAESLCNVLLDASLLACFTVMILVTIKRHYYHKPFAFGPFLAFSASLHAWHSYLL